MPCWHHHCHFLEGEGEPWLNTGTTKDDTPAWRKYNPKGGILSLKSHSGQFALNLEVAWTKTPFCGPNVSADLNCKGSYIGMKIQSSVSLTSTMYVNQFLFRYKIMQLSSAIMHSILWSWLILRPSINASVINKIGYYRHILMKLASEALTTRTDGPSSDVQIKSAYNLLCSTLEAESDLAIL